jgi:hypothetical protein
MAEMLEPQQDLIEEGDLRLWLETEALLQYGAELLRTTEELIETSRQLLAAKAALMEQRRRVIRGRSPN